MLKHWYAEVPCPGWPYGHSSWWLGIPLLSSSGMVTLGSWSSPANVNNDILKMAVSWSSSIHLLWIFLVSAILSLLMICHPLVILHRPTESGDHHHRYTSISPWSSSRRNCRQSVGFSDHLPGTAQLRLRTHTGQAGQGFGASSWQERSPSMVKWVDPNITRLEIT